VSNDKGEYQFKQDEKLFMKVEVTAGSCSYESSIYSWHLVESSVQRSNGVTKYVPPPPPKKIDFMPAISKNDSFNNKK